MRVFKKWGTLSLILFVSSILQSTPGFLQIEQIKPLLILPSALSAAFFAKYLPTAIFASIAGLLIDISSYRLFGFSALILLILSVIISLLMTFLINPNLLNCSLIAAAAIFIFLSVDFFFSYVVWQYDNLSLIFMNSYIPTFIYTSLIFPLFFILTRKIFNKFEEIG